MLKVLIIDDDNSFVAELRLKLKDWGVVLTKSESTEGGGIKAIIEFEPDLVICGVYFNGHNSGLVLSEFLANRRVPFIIVTHLQDDGLYNELIKFEPIAYFHQTTRLPGA